MKDFILMVKTYKTSKCTDRDSIRRDYLQTFTENQQTDQFELEMIKKPENINTIYKK